MQFSSNVEHNVVVFDLAFADFVLLLLELELPLAASSLSGLSSDKSSRVSLVFLSSSRRRESIAISDVVSSVDLTRVTSDSRRSILVASLFCSFLTKPQIKRATRCCMTLSRIDSDVDSSDTSCLARSDARSTYRRGVSSRNDRTVKSNSAGFSATPVLVDTMSYDASSWSLMEEEAAMSLGSAWKRLVEAVRVVAPFLS